MIQGLKVQELAFRVRGLGFWVYGSEFRVKGKVLELRI
jgi:hypothetical protein